MKRFGTKRALAAAGLALTLGMAAGCAGKTAGHGQPRSSGAPTSASASQAVPNSGAPKVAQPLKAESFLQRPCSVLTATQLDALNLHVDGKSETTGGVGPVCKWNDFGGATEGAYSVTFVKGGDGLSGPYSNKDSSFFKEVPAISGQPSVISMNGDGRSSGRCTIDVGLSDQQIIAVGAYMGPNAPNYKNSCGVSAKLAEKMVETIKGAQ